VRALASGVVVLGCRVWVGVPARRRAMVVAASRLGRGSWRAWRHWFGLGRDVPVQSETALTAAAAAAAAATGPSDPNLVVQCISTVSVAEPQP